MARRNEKIGSRASLARSTDAKGWLLGQLANLLRDHGRDFAREGEHFLDEIESFGYGSNARCFYCSVLGVGSSIFEVEIYLPRDHDEEIAVTCTCPYWSFSQDFCPHTWAALTRLCGTIDQGVDEEIWREVLDFKQSAPWERTLSVLDDFIDTLAVQAQEAAAPAERIVWRVAISVGELELLPYVQKRTKNGKKWSRGKKISWQRFLDDEQLHHTPADRAASAAVRSSDDEFGYFYYSRNIYHIDTFAALQALIDHPLVFFQDAPTVPVTVSKAELGLAVVPAKGGIRIDAAVDGLAIHKIPTHSKFFTFSEGAIVVNCSESQIRVAGGDPNIVMLAAQANANCDHIVPNEVKEELLARLSQLETAVPVSLPDKLLGGKHNADGRIHLLLAPRDPAGASVVMQVRPVAEGGHCNPGEGPEKLTGLLDDVRVLFQRDLKAELKKADALASELGLAEHIEERPRHWRIEEDDEVLNLIHAVDQHEGDDVVLEWADQSRKMDVVGELLPAELRVRIEDGKDWFGLKGTIEVAGVKIPLLTLLVGLQAGRKYVELGKGQWAKITDGFRERLAALADVTHVTRNRIEIDATSAPVVADLLDDSATLKACQRWRQMFKRLEAADEIQPVPPATFTAEFRDYQLEGYRWMRRLAAWGVGACLADDMGLGKTVQALALLVDRAENGPALVVAPTSVGFNWIRETQRFAPSLNATLYRETDREQFLEDLKPGDVAVISYGLVQRDIKKLSQVNWGTLVLDEAQCVKNAQTKTAQAVRALDADWKLALTGTPLENHLGELWSLFRNISPGLFGSWERFRKRFAEPIEKRKDVGSRHALARVVRPFLLRRTKAEVLNELPPRTEIQLVAEMCGEERKRYDDARLQAVAQLSDVGAEQDQRFHVLAALTRLRQLACHPRLVDPSWTKSSAKMDLLLEQLEELREGRHRALVFSQFTKHLALIREMLDERGFTYQYIDGQTTAKQRENRVDAFQHGEGDLFLISLKAGGTGLNLTAADYVVHIDPWWNPAVEDQATDRTHRIGQTRPVTVYRLVTAGTVEEQILALHAQKRDLVAGVLEGADRAGKLSTEELIDLIRADKDDGGQTHHQGFLKKRAKKAIADA